MILGPYQTEACEPPIMPRPRPEGREDLPLPPALGDIVIRYALNPQALAPGERTVGRVITARLAWVRLKPGRVFRLPDVATYFEESGEE